MARVVVLILALATAAGCTGARPPAQPPLVPASLTPIPVARDRSHDFARVFCSTLPHTTDRDGKAWGDCARYIEPSETAAPLPAMAAPYRFLIVGGFGDACFAGARAFGTAAAHLRDAHQIDVDLFAVAPFASSEENGKSIARQIDAGWASDQTRRYVLIGYDKGAPDLLEAMRLIADPASKVAAVATIAGVVGGLWRSDALLALVNPSKPWMSPQCPGNQADGLHSLLRDVRLRFLRENPLPVPGYSIVAASREADTSSALREGWKRLSIYSADEDGLLLTSDAVLPDATFLGSLKADHWAVALPFDALSKPPKGIDQNRFPRDALLEAMVRYISGDLQAAQKRGSPGAARRVR